MVTDKDRRSGSGRRSSDLSPIETRVTLLEDFVDQQFTPGKSIHAQDHERIREAEREHRRVKLSITERGLWAALCFFAVAAWEALRRSA